MNMHVAIESLSKGTKDEGWHKKIVEKIKEIIEKTIKFVKGMGYAIVKGCGEGLAVGEAIAPYLPPGAKIIVISVCVAGGGIVEGVKYVIEHPDEPKKEEPHQANKNSYVPEHKIMDIKEGGVSVEEEIDADAILQQEALQKETPRLEMQLSHGPRM